MTVLSLQPDSIQEHLPNSRWLVACLCAAWCDTCNAYRSAFEALAEKHPDKCFCWIDIEDQASLVEDIDIENFPTILVGTKKLRNPKFKDLDKWLEASMK